LKNYFQNTILFSIFKLLFKTILPITVEINVFAFSPSLKEFSELCYSWSGIWYPKQCSNKYWVGLVYIW